MPDGDRYRGAAAANAVADALVGGRVFRQLYNLPLIGAAQDTIDAMFVRNRSKLPGTTPALHQPTPWNPQR